jgi:hypothetical protein
MPYIVSEPEKKTNHLSNDVSTFRLYRFLGYESICTAQFAKKLVCQRFDILLRNSEGGFRSIHEKLQSEGNESKGQMPITSAFFFLKKCLGGYSQFDSRKSPVSV